MKKLTKPEVLTMVNNLGLGYDLTGKVMMKVTDHENNPISPERYCYRLHFTQLGVKRAINFWPHTVGVQA